MRIKYPSIFGVLAILMLVASFVVPANLATPAPAEAMDPICQWDVVPTPGMTALLVHDVLQPYLHGVPPMPTDPDTFQDAYETSDIVIGNDGQTIWMVDRGSTWTLPQPAPAGVILGTEGQVLKSAAGGLAASDIYAGYNPLKGSYLSNTLAWAPALPDPGGYPVWFIALAPDDVNFVVAVVDKSRADGVTTGPGEIWISQDGGVTWEFTNFINSVALPPAEYISCVDVSMKYGTARDVLVGTRTGGAGGNIYVMKAPGFATWQPQITAVNTLWDGSATADVYAIKASPTYVGDATMVAVVSPVLNNANTYVVMGLRDLAVTSATTDWATYIGVEVRASTGTLVNQSPGILDMFGADLELPSDFSGQSASMRRVYVSLDAAPTPFGAFFVSAGIFRVDDQTVYMLMDTSGQAGPPNFKRIHSIAYWGTYASGKLLAGEVYGWACTATVPTWFTDSPTVCPVPCWYPALKPTTGAANQAPCAVNNRGFGNAVVAWSPVFADQGVAYVGTSAANVAIPGVLMAPGVWPFAWTNDVRLDESAFGLTRNNGETWNQLAMIDTFIYKFTDVAPSADCGIVYLASTNNYTAPDAPNPGFCKGFDSVWRSGTNAAVQMPPLPGLPLGVYWERVLTHLTTTTCTNLPESQHAILRLAPDKTDGQIVFWGAGGTQGLTNPFVPIPGTWGASNLVFGPNTRMVAWTPDYGDFWANVNPRLSVQDLSAASSTMIYVAGAPAAGAFGSRVQVMPYSGTAWSSAEMDRDALIPVHMIMARYDVVNKKSSDWALVGDAGAFSAIAPVAWSDSQFKTYGYPVAPTGEAASNVHVAFDSKFEDNKIIYAGFDGPAGGVWRYTIGTSAMWDNMMAPGSAAGLFHNVGIFGLAVAYTGAGGSGALYAAHRAVGPLGVVGVAPAGVDRNLWPTSPIPKPGSIWDCLNWFAQTPGAGPLNAGLFPSTFGINYMVQFTEEPWSLKHCGCLSLDTDTNLMAIDNSNVYVTTLTGGRGVGMGDLWMFTDCLAKRGPVLTMDDESLIGCDPVSGRNQEINFTWEQLCVSIGYDIEIAKDEAFTLRVFDMVGVNNPAVPLPGVAAPQFGFRPSSVTSPAFIFPVAAGAGAFAAAPPALVSALECGHTYYWKVQVRQCVTGQVVRSPWSEVREFTIKAGLPVSMPYYGLQLLAPDNGCIGCPVKPASFSWSPYKETATYKFVLAKDSQMTQIVVEDTTATTGYEYDGTLDYSTNYFWRVMALEPAPSDWSATFSFMTAAAPPAPEEAAGPAPTPLWVWVVIAIGAILVIVTLVLIFKTRRV